MPRSFCYTFKLSSVGVKLSAVGLPGSTPYQQRYDPRNEDNGKHYHRPR